MSVEILRRKNGNRVGGRRRRILSVTSSMVTMEGAMMTMIMVAIISAEATIGEATAVIRRGNDDASDC